MVPTVKVITRPADIKKDLLLITKPSVLLQTIYTTKRFRPASFKALLFNGCILYARAEPLQAPEPETTPKPEYVAELAAKPQRLLSAPHVPAKSDPVPGNPPARRARKRTDLLQSTPELATIGERLVVFRVRFQLLPLA
jgi:hypothetical protein